MDFKSVISTRRAIRKYKTTPISDDKLKNLYDALIKAPTGNNHQPFRFIFVNDGDKRKELVDKACHQQSFADAPVIMVACCEKGRAFDTAIAVDHLTLAAVDEGLCTCWEGWFEREAVRKLLDIPENMEIPIIIPIGYPDENPGPRPRKAVDQLICTDTYK